MNNEQKKSRLAKFNVWLPNLYYVGSLITLTFIMAQVFYAKRAMVESSEWEKAKVTIDNVERFKEKITKSKLYGTDALFFADKSWPDFATPEGNKFADRLRTVYYSFFFSEIELQEKLQKGIEPILFDNHELLKDFLETLNMLDAFAYPIIMGYASEMGSFQMAIWEYYTLSNFIMPDVFAQHQDINMGQSAKLLYRLWRIRIEQLDTKRVIDSDYDENVIKDLDKNKNRMLCFEGAELTPASIQKYEKKLKKELKKTQKEIEVFRKNNLK